MQFAQENNLQSEANSSTDTSGNLVFSNLDLGYYLVDSSVGALCNLTTTNPMSSIEEKNEVPTVTKKVYDGEKFSDHNNASIGDTVTFKTEIKIEKGATNYVLHDEMGKGLELVEVLKKLFHFVAPDGYPEPKENDYTVERNKQEDSDGFTISFKDSYIQTLPAGNYLTLTYYAKVTNDAPINIAMNNKTWLTFGDNNTSTNESETNTYTFGIPVFKYTKKGSNETPLAGASFALYDDEGCKKLVDLIQSSNGENYRLFISGDEDANKVLAVTTNDTGSFNITGLKAGAYYLKEIEAPKGYNKLAAPIKVEIDNNGNVKVNGADADKVKVENKTGTLLPSTGGMGTTMIYMAGAILVVASGIVLVSKKRSKAK